MFYFSKGSDFKSKTNLQTWASLGSEVCCHNGALTNKIGCRACYHDLFALLEEKHKQILWARDV